MTLPRKAGYVVTRHTVQFFSTSTNAASNSSPLHTTSSNASSIFGQLPFADPFSHVNVTIPAYARSIDNNAQFFSTSPYVAAYPPARFVAEAEALSAATSHVEASVDHLPSLNWNWTSNDQAEAGASMMAPPTLVDSGESQIRTAESLSFEEIAQKKHAVTASPYLPMMLQCLDPYKSQRLQLCDKFKESLPSELESFDIDLTPFLQEETTNNEYVAKLNQAKQKFESEIAKLNVTSNEFCNQIMISLKEQSLRRPILDEEPSIKIAIVQTKFYHLKRQLKQYVMKGLRSLQMENAKAPKRKNLPTEACDILLKWFLAHLSGPAGPYPSEDDKVQLSKLTNLSIKQINYWFSNKRMRYKRKCMATQNNTSMVSSSSNTSNNTDHSTSNSGDGTNSQGESQTSNADLVHSAFDFQPTTEPIILPSLATKDTSSYLVTNIDSGSQPLSQPHQQ